MIIIMTSLGYQRCNSLSVLGVWTILTAEISVVHAASTSASTCKDFILGSVFGTFLGCLLVFTLGGYVLYRLKTRRERERPSQDVEGSKNENFQSEDADRGPDKEVKPAPQNGSVIFAAEARAEDNNLNDVTLETSFSSGGETNDDMLDMPYPLERIYSVVEKKPNRNLGFSIAVAGLYVTAVENQQAEWIGDVEPGDEIVSINGVPVEGMTEMEAYALIARSGTSVEFEINKGTFSQKLRKPRRSKDRGTRCEERQDREDPSSRCPSRLGERKPSTESIGIQTELEGFYAVDEVDNKKADLPLIEAEVVTQPVPPPITADTPEHRSGSENRSTVDDNFPVDEDVGDAISGVNCAASTKELASTNDTGVALATNSDQADVVVTTNSGSTIYFSDIEDCKQQLKNEQNLQETNQPWKEDHSSSEKLNKLIPISRIEDTPKTTTPHPINTTQSNLSSSNLKQDLNEESTRSVYSPAHLKSPSEGSGLYSNIKRASGSISSRPRSAGRSSDSLLNQASVAATNPRELVPSSDFSVQRHGVPDYFSRVFHITPSSTNANVQSPISSSVPTGSNGHNPSAVTKAGHVVPTGEDGVHVKTSLQSTNIRSASADSVLLNDSTTHPTTHFASLDLDSPHQGRTYASPARRSNEFDSPNSIHKIGNTPRPTSLDFYPTISTAPVLPSPTNYDFQKNGFQPGTSPRDATTDFGYGTRAPLTSRGDFGTVNAYVSLLQQQVPQRRIGDSDMVPRSVFTHPIAHPRRSSDEYVPQSRPGVIRKVPPAHMNGHRRPKVLLPDDDLDDDLTPSFYKTYRQENIAIDQELMRYMTGKYSEPRFPTTVESKIPVTIPTTDPPPYTAIATPDYVNSSYLAATTGQEFPYSSGDYTSILNQYEFLKRNEGDIGSYDNPETTMALNGYPFRQSMSDLSKSTQLPRERTFSLKQREIFFKELASRNEQSVPKLSLKERLHHMREGHNYSTVGDTVLTMPSLGNGLSAPPSTQLYQPQIITAPTYVSNDYAEYDRNAVHNVTTIPSSHVITDTAAAPLQIPGQHPIANQNGSTNRNRKRSRPGKSLYSGSREDLRKQPHRTHSLPAAQMEKLRPRGRSAGPEDEEAVTRAIRTRRNKRDDSFDRRKSIDSGSLRKLAVELQSNPSLSNDLPMIARLLNGTHLPVESHSSSLHRPKSTDALYSHF